MNQQLRNERRKALHELGKGTLTWILLFTALSMWGLVMLLDVRLPSMPRSILALWAVIQAICLVSQALRARSEQLAVGALVSGLWLCTAWSAVNLAAELVYLFIAVHLITTMFLGRRAAFALAVCSTVFILNGLPADAPKFDTLLPLGILWYSLFTGFVLVTNLYNAVDISWSYQTYAVQQMESARAHRGELMRVTKALQEARSDLENSLIQLRFAKRAAEAAQRLKAQFAANVSHELRTPINLIVGFAEMIATAPTAYRAPLPSAYFADFNTIYRNAKHLQGLINDVLDISQIEAGQMSVLREEADPGEVVLEAANLVREHIASRKLDFQVHIESPLPRMVIDRIRIRQVILNLLSNAIRFTDDGSITIRVGFQADAECLLITVSDTGIGIRPEDLDRVFEEFHQLDGSLARRYGGSGLGLTLSKHFVEMHGGTLHIESEGVPGKGSTFIIRLPVKPVSAYKPALHGTTGPEPSQKVFVVYDDDPSIAHLFERYTEQHKVLWANTAAECDHLLAAVRPAALVIDLENKGQPTAQTPVIRCTMPSGRRRMQHAGVSDYLVKPVTQTALQQALLRLERPFQSILIIDDDPEIVRLFSRMLSSFAQTAEVWKAYGGQEGLALLEQVRPDLVILDWLMPDVNGETLLTHIRAAPTLKDTAVIVASARGASEALTVPLDGSLNVSKPGGFQPVELVRCVEALIGSFIPEVEPAS